MLKPQDDSLADLLFNGICGYRAQYYDNPKDGLNANGYAFGVLEEKLLQVARNNDFKYKDDKGNCLRMSDDYVLVSLRHDSAKIWGDEHDGELHQIVCARQLFQPQIVAQRGSTMPRGDDRALKGVRAPNIRTLKFKVPF